MMLFVIEHIFLLLSINT